MRPVVGLAVTAVLSACGSAGPAPEGAISGTVQGIAWHSYASALWIGKPSPGLTILFLLESPTACAAVSQFNWDKVIGNERVLEIGLATAPPQTRSYAVTAEASVAYLRGDYNPDADGGSVTIAEVVSGQHLAGSFAASFGGEGLRGTFAAAYCPDGVEP